MSVTTSSNSIIFIKIVSQSLVESKMAKEIKNGIRDRTVSKSVRTLQVITVIVGIILIIMSCMFAYEISYPIFNSIWKHREYKRYVQHVFKCL